MDEELDNRSKKKFVNILEVTVSVHISWKLVREIGLIIFRSSSNMGHLGSKTRSHSPNVDVFRQGFLET